MSVPISECVVLKAAVGDALSLERLVLSMQFNKKAGHYDLIPCTCNPHCPVPTAEQLVALHCKVTEALEKGFLPVATPTTCCGVSLLVRSDGTVYKCPCGDVSYVF